MAPAENADFPPSREG